MRSGQINLSEKYYWDKQIERHHIGKKIRNLARLYDDMPFKRIADELGISSKTVWARKDINIRQHMVCSDR